MIVQFARPTVTIDRLPFAEQFVVWAMRLRQTAGDTGEGFAQLRYGFLLARAEDGLGHFNRLMSVLDAAAIRPLDIRCLTCRRVGRDEARLLAVLAAFQDERYGMCDALLADIVPPSAARIAADQACILARIMDDAGLSLGRRRSADVIAANAAPSAAAH